MKTGPTSLVNHGTHYGFVESGVIFSSLVPALATLYTTKDGTTEMRNWTDADTALESKVRHARQNGMALIEPDESGKPIPGRLVNQWLPGNWGGSAAIELRTMRSGTCLQEVGSRRFLIYAWFPTATPSAMARVFQAYGCKFAMHMDMNAPVHTYLAVYGRSGDSVATEHLATSMAENDPMVGGKHLPRFLAVSDDRDFYYITRRKK